MGDSISASPGEEGAQSAGVVGDNNRTNDNRDDEEAKAGSFSIPTVNDREFDQAATNPPLLRFVVFSDVVDSNNEQRLNLLGLQMENK